VIDRVVAYCFGRDHSVDQGVEKCPIVVFG
jgi:hypothetical protein